MKSLFVKIFAVLLCIAVIGGVMYATTAEEKPTYGTIVEDDGKGTGQVDDSGMEEDTSGGNQSNGDGLNGSVDTPTEEVDRTLKAPSNLSSLLASGMEMMSGASIYVGSDESLDPAIRFTCLVENTLVNTLKNDSTKQAGMLMAPLDYFDAVNTDNYTYIDWVKAFDTAGKTYVLTLFDGYGTYDSDTSFVRVNLTNVLYHNMNRKFVAIGVVITTNGENVSYQYSSFASGVDYRSNARSVAYVASASLNAHTLGMETFSDDKLAKIKSYINMSVDQANGLEETTNDGSMYALNVVSGTEKTLSVGGTFEVKTEMAPKVEVPIWYRSSDTSIITVDDAGKVTAVKAGTAKVRIFLAGVEYTVTVTVN